MEWLTPLSMISTCGCRRHSARVFFPDGREPDNVEANATGLPQGVSADAPFTGTLCGLADTDFFAIDLAAGDRINLTLTNNDQGGFPLEMALYRDAAGRS